MRKYTIIFILLLIILANGWSQAQTIAMRIADTTVVSGNNIDVPIYADSSLTGKNVMSYMLQLSYNQSYFQPISVIVAGTISSSFGNPTVNTSVPGIISIAGAGTTSLIGQGKFIYIRFKALQPGGLNLSFTGPDYNYFNEGIPAMSFINGNISISASPSIAVYPDNGIITIGEQLQFNVSGGSAPFQWFVTNPSAADIDASGMLTGMQLGFTKVVAQDNDGLKDTTNMIEIRAMRLSIPNDLSEWQGAFIDIPVNTTDLSGLNIYSGNFTISFNQNLLTPVGVVQTGTLLASYPVPVFNISSPGNFSMAFAGLAPLAGSGTLIYVRFQVSDQNTGTTDMAFINGIFNETILPTFTNGYFTTINLPVLSISPNTGYLIAGETQQFTVNGGGILPLTWNVSDTVVASINQSGLMIANRSGVVIVTVHDSIGATASTGNFQIYDTRINMSDTVTCPESPTFYYPIQINSLPSGESVFSIQATINYDTTYLAFLDIETAGTLTQGWTYAKNPTAGQLIFAGSSTSSFNTSGTILNLKFNIKPNFITGSNAYINLNNVTLNEGVPLPLVDIYGHIAATNPESAGAITGSSNVCQGQQNVVYSVPTILGATSYVWTMPTGATGTSTTNSINVNYSNSAVSGNITVKGISTCGEGATSNFFIVVNDKPSAPIIGIITQPTCTVPTGSVELNGLPSGNWILDPGSIAGSTTNTTISELLTGTHSYIVTTEAGCTSVVSGNVVINVQPATPSVTNQTISILTGGTFTITPGGVPVGTTYTWAAPSYIGGVTGGIAQTIPQSNISGSLTIPSGNGTATYTVTPTFGFCVGAPFTVTVTVTTSCVPVTVGIQPADNSMCATSGNISFTVDVSGTSPFTFQWQFNNIGTWENVANGAPTGSLYSNATTATLGVSGIATNGIFQYRCYITNCIDTSNATSNIAVLTVNAPPAVPIVGLITQPTCTEQTGSVELNDLPATGIWTINPGSITGTGTSSTITGLTAGTYAYTVTNASGCLSAASSDVVINVQPATPSVTNQTISILTGGTFTITPGGVPVGTTYTWTAPIYTGGVTGGIEELIPQSNISGSLAIPSGAGTATYVVTPISGSCVGATFTAIVTVTTSCVPVTIGTQPADNSMCAISGNTSFTVSASGTFPFIYQWQYNNVGTWENVANDVPAGALYLNATTANLDVIGIIMAGSHQYRCYITNCSDVSNITSNVATLTVNALPTAGTISGTSIVCQGQNTVTYNVSSITNATSYVWTLPAGAIIISESNTESLTVNYSDTAISGNITVYGTNDCGNGAVSSDFAVTVNPVYAFLENHSICNGEIYNWHGTDYSTAGLFAANYSSINGCDSIYTLNLIVNSVDTGVSLSGSTLTTNSTADAYQWVDCDNSFSPINGEVFQSFTAIVNGNYAVILTQGLCIDTSACEQVTIIGIDLNEKNKSVKIYPIPVSDELIIEVKGNMKNTNFEILNSIGQVVFKGNLVERMIVQASNFFPGVYFIKLEIDNAIEFMKIIKE